MRHSRRLIRHGIQQHQHQCRKRQTKEKTYPGGRERATSAVSERCAVLRTVCASAANTVKGTHSHAHETIASVMSSSIRSPCASVSR